MHNSISLDGSLTGFDVDMELHYQLAGTFDADLFLIGSNTIKTGIELYGEGVAVEESSDFQKPKRDPSLPLWMIIDTKASLMGMLHMCRRFEFCRDVGVLISEKTSSEYVDYLRDRNYEYHMVGFDHVDLSKAVDLLGETYRVKTMVTDAGRILCNLLLNQGLVDQVSLLVHPVVVGDQSYPMFSDISKKISLSIKNQECYKKKFVWVVYTVDNR